MVGEDTPPSRSFILAALILALVCAFLFFYRLKAEDIHLESQARSLLVAAEMKQAGAWMAPFAGQETRTPHPPLFSWCVRLAAATAQKIAPTHARIPGAIATTLMVFLGAWWTLSHIRRYPRDDNPDMNPEVPALFAGILIATTPLVFGQARAGTPDALFAFFCFAALYCFGESFESRRSFYAGVPWRRWAGTGYAFLALAILTKGPVAILFVMLPYLATSLNYKMRKLDWIHALAPVAMLPAAAWYVWAANNDAALRDLISLELFRRRFGSGAVSPESIFFYLKIVGRNFFPWMLLAGVMAYRTVIVGERTPTRELWAWSAILPLVWLSIPTDKNDQYLLPAAPFVMLLSCDALLHWNFDSIAGKAFRVMIRVVRWVAILVAIPVSVIFASDVGLGVFLGLGAACFVFLFHRSRSTAVYAWWERTMQGAWFLTLALLGFEAAYLVDYIPRRNTHDPHRAFIAQMREHLPDDANLHLYGRNSAALYNYSLGQILPITRKVSELSKVADDNTYLVSDTEIAELMSHPNLAVIATRQTGDSDKRPRAALFKVLKSDDHPKPQSMTEKYSDVAPLRIAVLGDPALDGVGQEATVKRLRKISSYAPFHNVFLLGSKLEGKSPYARLNFERSFERSYSKLLRDGLPFHAVLSDEDKPIEWFVIHYDIFQMAGERHYAYDLRGGLVRFYALDATAFDRADPVTQRQLKWLEDDLKETRAIWRIVALSRPLASLAEKNQNISAVAPLLRPILESGKVQAVFCSGETHYERFAESEQSPVVFTAGWSSRAVNAKFAADSRLKVAYDEEPGFITLDITSERIKFLAINVRGELVDGGLILPSGGVRDTEGVVSEFDRVREESKREPETNEPPQSP